MAKRGKIFISYRRDDVPGDARNLYKELARTFGQANVFMDVDKLLAGQRFDLELGRALSQCNALLAVIGPRWMDLLSDRARGGERDFVHDEIAAALKRDIVVIPVLIGREERMPSLPRRDHLPEDVRALVLHQKKSIAHESFDRDAAELIVEIETVLRDRRQALPWRSIAISAAVALALTMAVFGYWIGVIPRMGAGTDGATHTAQSDLNRAAADESARKKTADEAAVRMKSDEQAKLAAGADCDLLAGLPSDASRPKGVAGVDVTKIDAAAARTACDSAMRLNPEIARFVFQAGRVADARKDYTRALELYRAAVDKGSTIAMVSIGNMYSDGDGVARDYAEARRWYEKAAALDEPAAFNSLGVLYDGGQGVRQSYAEARKWYEKAAGLGNAAAMWNLGLLYESGRGVAKDREQARKWYQKAADAGDAEAKETLKNFR